MAPARRADGNVDRDRGSAVAAARSARRERRALSAAGAADRKRRARDSRRSGAGGHAASPAIARARGAADALRQRAARQEADREPAVGARGAAHEGRRLQRAHGAVRRHGAIDWHSGANRRRPGVHARRLLLPRVARGLSSTEGRWPRTLAARRSDAESVSGRRDAPAAGARRPRQAGGRSCR